MLLGFMREKYSEHKNSYLGKHLIHVEIEWKIIRYPTAFLHMYFVENVLLKEVLQSTKNSQKNSIQIGNAYLTNGSDKTNQEKSVKSNLLLLV